MSSTSARTAKRRPEIDTVFTINEDGSRNFIHTADVKGPWHTFRNAVHLLLLLVYVGVPWIQIGGYPAVHLDLPGRQAFLFGQTFTNQDFYLVFFLVTGLGFGLFVVTALWGRIFCGYVCPQTVFVDGVFRRVERWFEGSREKRLRLNQGPWNLNKILRKTGKHIAFILLATASAHVFLSYFIPIRELIPAVLSGPGGHSSAFIWATVWTGILYFDYSWFREQTCLVICPYGRLQSALTDSDTMVVGYDENRGEPRGKKGSDGVGDCVDCFRCVTVCPTGIDIRNGLQMECIGCTACIDACNTVMQKLERPKGLIRYDSLNGFLSGKRRSIFRPRVFLYGFLGLLGLTVFTITAMSRSPYEVRVLRPKGLPYQIKETSIQNLYNLRIQNKSQEPATYYVEFAGFADPENPDEVASADAGMPPLDVVLAQKSVRIEPLEDVTVPAFVTMVRDDYSGNMPIYFAVSDSAAKTSRKVKAVFRGP